MAPSLLLHRSQYHLPSAIVKPLSCSHIVWARLSPDERVELAKRTVLHGHPQESSQNSWGSDWSVFFGSFGLLVKSSFYTCCMYGELGPNWTLHSSTALFRFWYLEINQNQMLTFTFSVSFAAWGLSTAFICKWNLQEELWKQDSWQSFAVPHLPKWQATRGR